MSDRRMLLMHLWRNMLRVLKRRMNMRYINGTIWRAIWDTVDWSGGRRSWICYTTIQRNIAWEGVVKEVSDQKWSIHT